MNEHYLWLLQVMGAANPRSIQLIRHYGSPEAVYEAFGKLGGNVKLLKPGEAENLKTASLEKSQEIMQICTEYNYRILTLTDDDYPTALKNIYNPPIVLFVSGSLPADEQLCITVIGTRDACDYSLKVTQNLCRKLAKAGVTIVSGMAVGIDKAAHTAAVEVKGRTIGTLACGFAVDYPKFSTPFRNEIINSGGAVITELLPYSRGERGYFNERNRIMSGLSRGVLIIEAAEKSGCHITASHAINQNRDLFCIPPSNLFSSRFRGVINYLRDGAVPVFDHSDILNEYLTDYTDVDATDIKYSSGGGKETEDGSGHFEKDTGQINNNADRKSLFKSAAVKPFNIVPEKPPEADLSALEGNALTIAELLKDGSKTVDFLAENSALSVNELSELLLELEIDGVIESAAGSSYILKTKDSI
ncbi:MAG: DNA-processing protein DprA [Oscillospiraceae bacterium]|nr:DNA-processing protein DprA [Oscillospiraceae bacterium]